MRFNSTAVALELTSLSCTVIVEDPRTVFQHQLMAMFQIFIVERAERRRAIRQLESH